MRCENPLAHVVSGVGPSVTRVRPLWTIVYAILVVCAAVSSFSPSAVATMTRDAAAICVYDGAPENAFRACAPSRVGVGGNADRVAQSKAATQPISLRVEGSTLATGSRFATEAGDRSGDSER